MRSTILVAQPHQQYNSALHIWLQSESVFYLHISGIIGGGLNLHHN